jgi:hypothetical protein
MTGLTPQDVDTLIRDRAVRLLVLSNGRHIWEASPSPLHQMLVDETRAAIQPTASQHRGDTHAGCGCYHLADVYIRLPDDSLVRPDISIFCEQPPRQRHALTLVPVAVIEVISPQYEAKDLQELPPIYLANGIADVLVLDADQQQVTHFHRGGTLHYPLPATVDLPCGCRCRFAG